MLLQVTHGERHADGVWRERSPGWPEHLRASRKGSAPKRNIGSDNDVGWASFRGNPVVRGIGPLRYDYDPDHWIARRSQASIGDQDDLETVSFRNAQHLRLNRTGICIDEYSRSSHNGLITRLEQPGKRCDQRRPA